MKRPLAFAILSIATAVTILSAAQAQQKKTPAKKPPTTTAEAGEEGVREAGPLAAREERPQPAAKGAEKDAGVVEAKTLDGGARVFRFGEVEVEGRLKSPQIVYFLRRVRAEFAAGDLGHRTFMREMSETRNEPEF